MEFFFILSRPAVSGNIGAAARALKTMGFRHLRLAGETDPLDDEARMLAHGSHDILEEAGRYPTAAAAVEDLDLVIGTTARPRNIRQEYLPVTALQDFLNEKGKAVRRVGLLFGNESSGLSNEEIALCDILSYIPLATTFPSLNLAQAIMLYAWEMKKAFSPEKEKAIPSHEENGKALYPILKEKLRQVLPKIGIHEARPLYHRILERSALAGETDLHLLLSVADATWKELSRQE